MYKYLYVYTKIYMFINHFAVHQKITQHCKSTILQKKKKLLEEQLLPPSPCPYKDNFSYFDTSHFIS